MEPLVWYPNAGPFLEPNERPGSSMILPGHHTTYSRSLGEAPDIVGKRHRYIEVCHVYAMYTSWYTRYILVLYTDCIPYIPYIFLFTIDGRWWESCGIRVSPCPPLPSTRLHRRCFDSPVAGRWWSHAWKRHGFWYELWSVPCSVLIDTQWYTYGYMQKYTIIYHQITLINMIWYGFDM